MNKTALITGATKGIGLELARMHALHGGDLVLTARNSEELSKIKTQFESEYSVNVTVIPKDLSNRGAAKELFETIEQQDIDIHILINNAGFGCYEYFVDADPEGIQQMIDLNISSLTQMCYLFLNKYKGENKQRKILNVASIAAFQPSPRMAVYSATKAYVLSFSEAIRREVAKYGISVTTLCPGPTQTFFIQNAKMDNSNMVKGKRLPTATDVAEYGYSALLKGKSVAVHGLTNKFIIGLNRLLPRNWVLAMVEKIL